MTRSYANRFALLIVQVYRDVRKAHVLRKSLMGSRGDETGSCKVVLVVLGLELGLEKDVTNIRILLKATIGQDDGGGGPDGGENTDILRPDLCQQLQMLINCCGFFCSILCRGTCESF